MYRVGDASLDLWSDVGSFVTAEGFLNKTWATVSEVGGDLIVFNILFYTTPINRFRSFELYS